MYTCRDDNEGNKDGGDAFDFFSFLAEFFAFGDFFADQNENAGGGVDEAMKGVACNGNGVG